MDDPMNEPEPDVTQMTDAELADYGARLDTWELTAKREGRIRRKEDRDRDGGGYTSEENAYPDYVDRCNAVIREEKRRGWPEPEAPSFDDICPHSMQRPDRYN